MFDNIKNVKTKVRNQEMTEKGVVAKKAGRPYKPGMKTIQIRIDTTLNRQLKEYAKKLGLGKSQVIAIALKNEMKD